MSPGATFERVYLGIRQRLISGSFQPGAHLEPAHLSEELSASVTPVRDALHRLVGERMVETPRGDGFRVPIHTEVGLRHLYAWNSTLLVLATAGRHLQVADETGALSNDAYDSRERLAEAAAELFGSIARMSGNPEHAAAVDALSVRLAAVRLVEARILPDVGTELLAFRTLLQASPIDLSALRRLIVAFHRRRIKSVAAIVAAAQS